MICLKLPSFLLDAVRTLILIFVDGLQFRVLQETDGSRHLKMFWQDVDITQVPNTIQELLHDHELHRIFELRAITVVLNIIQQQLEDLTNIQGRTQGLGRQETRQAAYRLRSLEAAILDDSLHVLNEQVRPPAGFLRELRQHIFHCYRHKLNPSIIIIC